MTFLANFLITLTAHGAFFLNERLWQFLCRLMVYSRVTSVGFDFFGMVSRSKRAAENP